MRRIRTIRNVLCLVGAMLLAGGEAWALSGAYYSYASIYAFGGHVAATGGENGGTNTVTHIQADEVAAGHGPQSLAGGAPWFCPPTNPGCSISIAPGAGLGWAEASTDPVNGSVGTRDGAWHASGGPVPLRCVDFPPLGKICQPVPLWGEAASEASIRQAFVIESDGTLAPGDPVTVQASFLLEGGFTDDLWSGLAGMEPTGTVDAALLLTVYDPSDPAPFLEDDDFLNWGSVADILATPALAAHLEDYIRVGTNSMVLEDVSVSDSREVSLAVGDVIVMDLVLRGTAILQNDDEGRVAWAEFGNTLGGSLAPLTAGAVLTPLPEPGTALLMLAGLSGLAFLGGRRQARR